MDTNLERVKNRYLISLILLCGMLSSSNSEAAYIGWGDGNVAEINPISYNLTAVEFYDYGSALGNSASYNPPSVFPMLQGQSNVMMTFLYDGPDGLSWFVVFDQYKDGSGGSVNMEINSTGLVGENASFLVRDDPGDSTYAWDDATGSASLRFRWAACCTDGFVLGEINTAEWSLNAQFNSSTGIDLFKVYSMDDSQQISSFFIPGSEINSLTFYDVASSVPAPAPAPATIWLLGMGFMGLLGGVRAKKRTPVKLKMDNEII